MMSNDLFAFFMHYFILETFYGEIWLWESKRPFFFAGSQKVYQNADIDLSANISVIGFQI